MAIVREEVLRKIDLSKIYPGPLVPLMFATTVTSLLRQPKRPTKESIDRDVAKLRSVSVAGHKMIVARRMAIAGIGPWKDTFVFKRKDGGYPALIANPRPTYPHVTYELRPTPPEEGI